MTKPSITLCMIVRDVASYVGKALDSVIDQVDEIIIVDTGSVDTTLEVIREQCRALGRIQNLEIIPFTPETNPEAFLLDVPETFAHLEGSDVLREFSGKMMLSDFSRARQAGWDKAKTDFIMWIDSDDVVDGAEKISEIIEAMEARKLDTALMEYDYEVTAEGHVTCRLLRTRIARRSGPARWQQPIHEVLTPLGASEAFRQVRIVHRAAQLSDKVTIAARPPMRNLKVLINECARLTRDSKPIHPRLWFYLGNETRPHDHDRAIAYLGRYVKESDWEEEKALAHVYIGQLLEAHGKLIEARAHYASASVIFPDKPETHFGLARIAHYFQDHEACVQHHRAGEIACWRKRDTLHYNPYDRTLFPAICDGPSFIATGDYKKALKLAEDALVIQPESTHLHALRAVAQSKISERWRPREIAIWTGNALETWDPRAIDGQGIGGSETAAANMAKELAKLGHDVTVYSNCGPGAGIYDRVRYVHFEDVIEKMRIDCDIFISSRNVQIFDLDIRAAKKLLWFHDTEVGSAVVPQIAGNLLKADFFLTLSKWHRDLIHRTYPFVHPSKILVTRNGIDTSKFADEPNKIGNRMIYSSSPDRGLAILLEVFPRVREEVPDATLRVFYGFNNFERLVEKLASEDERSKGRQEVARLKAALNDIEGISFHGRVGQAQLAKEMLEAKVWSYLTWFSETSCQLAGSLIFTKDGMKPIEDIKMGDLVLTHKGRFRPVTQLIKRKYDGRLFSVKRRKDFRPITLTEEHPFYAVNFNKRSDAKTGRVFSHKHKKVGWKTPPQLKPERDYLISPRMEFGNLEKIFLSDYIPDMPVVGGMIGRNHNQPLWKTTKNEVLLTPELMYLLGMFVAEGCVSSSRKGQRQWYSAITFALHAREMHIATRIEKFFGEATTRPTSKNGITTTAHHSPWANFLKTIIGTGRAKRIPPFIWECSRELQAAFIRGAFEGDGSTSSTPRGNAQTTKPYLRYTSVSPSLTYGLAQLLANQGFYPGVNYSKERDAYTLNWTDDPKCVQHREISEGYATRVKDVSSRHYSGTVYNFEVEEDHSYVTDRTIVHNCISAMEAQAAGCVPVTSALAALNETVHHGFLLKPPATDEKYKNAAVKRIVWCLQNEAKRADMASRGRKEALKLHSWSSVAEEWDDMFARMMESRAVK